MEYHHNHHKLTYHMASSGSLLYDTHCLDSPRRCLGLLSYSASLDGILTVVLHSTKRKTMMTSSRCATVLEVMEVEVEAVGEVIRVG